MSNEKFTLIDVKKIINENKDCSDPLLYLSGIIEEKEREIAEFKDAIKSRNILQEEYEKQIQSLTNELTHYKELAEAAENLIISVEQFGEFDLRRLEKYQQLKNESH